MSVKRGPRSKRSHEGRYIHFTGKGWQKAGSGVRTLVYYSEQSGHLLNQPDPVPASDQTGIDAEERRIALMFLPKRMVIIVVQNKKADSVINAIIGLTVGDRGDGKIYISPYQHSSCADRGNRQQGTELIYLSQFPGVSHKSLFYKPYPYIQRTAEIVIRERRAVDLVHQLIELLNPDVVRKLVLPPGLHREPDPLRPEKHALDI